MQGQIEVNSRILERFEFRDIRQEEADQAVLIEKICFPPNEACSEKHMKERIGVTPELFLVAVDKTTGKLAGFLNGIATDEEKFRDEFFTDASLNNPKGKKVMILGLDVLPEYRGQGLAREIVRCYLQREEEKGRKERAIRVMIVGVPNVGKSSLINRLSGSASLKTADKPGVTRAKQWIKIKNNLDLLDTPGILWPKFEDPEVGLNLAFTGAISDEVYDIERAAEILLWRLKDDYAKNIKERYKIDEIPQTSEELFTLVGKKRGFLQKGGIVDTEKTAIAVLKDFRAGKLGKISLERP